MVALDGVAGAEPQCATDERYCPAQCDATSLLPFIAKHRAQRRKRWDIHIEVTRLAVVLLNIWTTLNANIYQAQATANYDAARWTGSVEHEAFMALLRARDAQVCGLLSAHTRKTGVPFLRR